MFVSFSFPSVLSDLISFAIILKIRSAKCACGVQYQTHDLANTPLPIQEKTADYNFGDKKKKKTHIFFFFWFLFLQRL